MIEEDEDDVNAILFKKSDLMALLKPYVRFIADNVLKEVGEGAFDAARKGYFWNEEMFKGFMQDTMDKMFFCQPDSSKEFKRTIEDSMKGIFEAWLVERLKEKDLEIILKGMATKIAEEAAFEKLKQIKDLPRKYPVEITHVNIEKESVQDDSIENCSLHLRAKNVLIKNGVTSLKEIIKEYESGNESFFLEMPGFGRKCLNDLEKFMKNFKKAARK